MEGLPNDVRPADGTACAALAPARSGVSPRAARLGAGALAAGLALGATGAQAAGFRTLEIAADEAGAALAVGLWYPSHEAVPAKPNTEFELAVALDAPPARTNGRLIVISHGHGGWYGGHADTAIALADAGYAVAAPSHAGDTWSDMSAPIERWILSRPADVSRTVDRVLEDPVLGARLDPARVGVYGFSAGGYTALALVGGVPDLDAAAGHCRVEPGEFVCAEGMVDELLDAGVGELPAEAFGADPRVSAAAIAAPGFGFGFTEASLAGVDAAIQLWTGELDESVPTGTNAAAVADRLPSRPELHRVAGADHFAFLTVACREAFRRDDPEGYALVCEDEDDFDRYAFHEAMHREMVRFFDGALGVGR